MKSATPPAIGTARHIASTPASTVPNTRAATPKTAGTASGFHCCSVRKLTESTLIAGTAFTTRNTAIAPMITRTAMPDADADHRRSRGGFELGVHLADLRHDAGRLGADAVGQRCVTEVGQQRLTLLAGGVVE